MWEGYTYSDVQRRPSPDMGPACCRYNDKSRLLRNNSPSEGALEIGR
jgi:hypothetical protein